MAGLSARTLPAWVVGLAVFLVVAFVCQLLLGGGAVLVAIPAGVVAGAVYGRRRLQRETRDDG
jgi:hypothetical protein